MGTSVSNSYSVARDQRPLDAWLALHGVVTIVAACATALTAQGAWLACGAAASFAALVRQRPAPSGSRRVLGAANALTTIRLAALLLAIAFGPRLPDGWVLAALVFNVAVDAVDGRVARRLGEATPFGAVFDREVDALFVLGAYLYVDAKHDVGAWVLLPGLLPYVYRFVAKASAVATAPDDRERLAAPLAAVNFVLLIAAVALAAQAAVIVQVSTAVVLISFGASFLGLYRRARSLS